MERLETGTSLVELLISLVVVSVGLLALSSLQMNSLSTNANANQRSLAANLAMQKLEDLRSFEQLEAGPPGVFGYDEIINSDKGSVGGGTEHHDGSLQFPSGKLSVPGLSFDLEWRVTDYYIPPQGALSQEPTATWIEPSWGPIPNRSDFKQVTVIIRWRDRGQTKDYRLTGSIPAITPAAVRSISTVRLPSPPKARYRPGKAPHVIRFSEGKNYRETSSPQVTISEAGETVTRIEQMTYDPSHTLLKRRQFVTVDCLCRQSSGSSGGRSPAIHSPQGLRVGHPVPKRTGIELTVGIYCTRCCRDHHDATGQPRFDPFRISGSENYPSHLEGDHSHSLPNQKGALIPADAENERYLEACRLTYKHGQLQTMQDWHLKKLHIIPADWLKDETHRAFYSKYLKELVNRQIDRTAHPTSPDCGGRPDDTSFRSLARKTHPVIRAPMPKHNEASAGSILIFQARALYIDHMPTELIGEIKCRQQTGRPYFHLIPYYEMDVSRLVDWKLEGTNLAGTHLRTGRLTVSGGASGTLTVSASLRRSNSGLTGTRPIDPDDRLEKSASIQVFLQ